MATISADILASYAADAAREVDGVRGLVESHLPRNRGVRISGEASELAVEIHLDVAWGASIPSVGEAVQRRVGDYLEQMAGARPRSVDVVVDAVGGPA